MAIVSSMKGGNGTLNRGMFVMEKRISEVLARHKVRLVRLEISKLFGNILLIVAAPHVQLRFVRDRGYNSCEVCKRNDGLHWEDDMLSASLRFCNLPDFCDFVDRVLTAKSL